jgi:hypothetical protein
MHMLQTIHHNGIHDTGSDRTMACARPATSSSDLLKRCNFHTLWQFGDRVVVLIPVHGRGQSDALSTRSSWRTTFRFRHGIHLQFRPLSILEGCGNCCIDQPVYRSGHPRSRERRGSSASSHNAHSEGLAHRATPVFL